MVNDFIATELDKVKDEEATIVNALVFLAFMAEEGLGHVIGIPNPNLHILWRYFLNKNVKF